MMRVVLIDDESFVLNGMSMVLKRDDSLELVGTASNGKDGLNLILIEKPDIVLTDIRMPEMDGLEMIRQVQNSCPDISFIIFSGFNEFQYVQQAIGMGVLDYLEKPVTIKALKGSLDKAKKMIEFKRNYIRMTKQQENISRVMVEQSLNNIMNQPKEMEQNHLTHLKEANSTLEFAAQICVLCIDQSQNSNLSADEFRTIIDEMTFGMVGNREIEFYMISQENSLFFVYFNMECEWFDFDAHICEAISRLENQEISCFFARGVGQKLEEIRSLLKETQKAAVYAFEHQIKQMVKAEEIIFISEDAEQKVEEEQAHMLIPQYHGPVQKTKQYIDEHFAESITLEMLAKHVDMNPAYLSVIFKKKMNISYSNYLANVRIEHSKRMLMQGMKAKEVCEKVGYFDYRHFSKQFKKITGMSPDEFRKSET